MMSARRGLRPDIQALRAVAVGAVVLDHTLDWPAGGFLGVDVFFVISGFLITALLLREVEATGRIDFRGFWARRLKRIAPLALVVLLVTTLAARATVNAARAAGIAQDALWAALFGANIRFERAGTDYFQSQGPVSPLQHFWSLSVEEQFYFVWPALIALLVLACRRATARTRRIVIGVVLTAAVAVSFAASVRITAANPTSAYFATPSRAWELGVGALLAVAAPLLARLPDPARIALAWSGTAGIIVSLALVDDSLPVPGPWAALPVLATAAVIGAGTGGTAPRIPFSEARVVQHLGTLSYALYLWHFPVFILGSLLLPDAPWAPFALIGVGVGLAAASHHLVEVPLMRLPWPGEAGETRGARRQRWTAWAAEVGVPARRAGLTLLATVTAIAVTVALIPSRPATVPLALGPAAADTRTDETSTSGADDSDAKGRAGASPEVTRLTGEIGSALAASAWPALDPTVDSVLDGSRPGSDVLPCGDSDATGLPQEECTWGPADATTTAVLVGDSTAMHYLDTLVGIATAKDSTLRLQNRAMFACPFVDAKIQNDTEGILEKCHSHNADTVAFLRETKPDVVFVTNSYQELTDADTGKPITAERWTTGLTDLLDDAAGRPRVVLLAPPPDDADIAECYTPRSGPADCVTRTQATWFDRFASDEAAVGKRKGGVVIPTEQLFCTDDLCPAFVGTVPVKEDRVHLTTAYAKKLVPAMTELLRSAKVMPG